MSRREPAGSPWMRLSVVRAAKGVAVRLEVLSLWIGVPKKRAGLMAGSVGFG
jgi:hypothetical protein